MLQKTASYRSTAQQLLRHIECAGDGWEFDTFVQRSYLFFFPFGLCFFLFVFFGDRCNSGHEGRCSASLLGVLTRPCRDEPLF